MMGGAEAGGLAARPLTSQKAQRQPTPKMRAERKRTRVMLISMTFLCEADCSRRGGKSEAGRFEKQVGEEAGAGSAVG